MDIDCSDDSNWLFDYGLVDALPVSAGDFTLPHSSAFNWPPRPLTDPSDLSIDVDSSFADSDGIKDVGSRKRSRPEPCSASGMKACREKLRRDKLNERFLELGSILEPGRPPKTDKVAVLSDAVRTVTQLRSESEKLKQSNEDLQVKIKELKAEKNELRDEKQRLKVDKEMLEQQLKALSAPSAFMPHPSAMSAAYSAQGPSGKKIMPFIGYPGVAMWQFMPPAAVDTSQDHVLRPPVA